MMHRCSSCKQSCPPAAISLVNGKLKVGLSKCIRCFCCQELCPKKAVDSKKAFGQLSSL